jgi:hypothetical protein
MSQNEGKGMPRGYAVHRESDVGVADATTRDLDQHLIGGGLEGIQFGELERAPHLGEAIAQRA